MAENKRPESEPTEADESGPMAMGMAMAKKMMGKMGQGGGPPEMMRKMMAQVRQGEGKSSTEAMTGICMGLWTETLNAIRDTNALAVHATPELEKVFSDWLEGLKEKAGEIVAKGETDGAALAAALGVSEASANYLLYRLATAGKVTLAAKVSTWRRP